MTSAKKRAPTPYYYSGGEKVELESVEDFCAIDPRKIRKGTKLRRNVDTIIKDTESGSYKDVSIVPTEAISLELAEELTRRGVFQPIYRRGDSMVVFLPEVRIEDERPEYRKKIRTLLKRLEPELTVDQRSYRAKVRPKSGRGADALDLANEIWETISPEFVQARMLRVTPRHARKH